MNRFFLFLLAGLALTACGKDADEPGRRGNQASERRELVSVRLSGDLELPYDDFGTDGKALTLVPETRATGAVLTPTYEEGEQVEAVAYATSLDGTQSSGPLTLTLSVGEKGRKFFYHGDLSLPSSMVGSKIKFAVFVGFDPATGELKAYPTTAPHYAKTGTRATIANYPIALQAKAEVDYVQEVKDGQNVSSYRHLGLRFGLVGSLIRCALTNDTDQELTVTGLELHGLGATGLKLAKPTSGTTEEVFVTSDEVDPSLSSRIYTLPAPKKLVAGAKEEYYLVYAPLVSQSDGRGLEYKGYVRPLLSDPTLQADYADGQTAKALPSDRGGKLAVTSVVLEEKSPIQPNAIPLQYWNNNYYYKPGGVPSYLSGWRNLPLLAYPSNDGYTFVFNRETTNQKDPDAFFFDPKDATLLSGVANLAASLHIPTLAELNGILPPEILDTDIAKRFLPRYYQTQGEYTLEPVEEIEVAGQSFVGQGSYWRRAFDLPFSEKLESYLYWGGDLSMQHPIYALRFGKLSDTELAKYKDKFKGKELAKNDKSRVAYMYMISQTGIIIYSCYIGENDDIQTAEDLYTKEVFHPKSAYPYAMKPTYNGHRIIRRIWISYGAQYSSKAVGSEARQLPKRRNYGWVSSTLANSDNFPGEHVPSSYYPYLRPSCPATGVLYRKTSKSTSLDCGWLMRNDEGQLTGWTRALGWYYEDDKGSGQEKYYIKSLLPLGSDRHFYFPLALISDQPQP